MSSEHGNVGPTRARDLAVVAVVAAVAAYAFTRLNYSDFPRLPRLAGLTAALLGIGEAVAGWGFRRRIRPHRELPDRRPGPRPIGPFLADRILRVAKASALASAALVGLWVGFGLYVMPESNRTAAAAADSATAIVGVISGAILVAGAVWLEFCCRVPPDQSDERPR